MIFGILSSEVYMLYEYKCNKCGNIIEVYQKMTESKFKVLFCDNCNEEVTVTRCICGSFFLLKGGGWAKDGYSKSNKNIGVKHNCDR